MEGGVVNRGRSHRFGAWTRHCSALLCTAARCHRFTPTQTHARVSFASLRVQKRIGKGGHATVFEAVDGSGVRFALKVSTDFAAGLREAALVRASDPRVLARRRCVHMSSCVEGAAELRVQAGREGGGKVVMTWNAYSPIWKHDLPLQMAELDKSGHANVTRSVMPSFTVTTATGRQLCQALELCDGDVLSLVEQSRCGGRLTECVARNVFRQVVAGLRHCHARGVWHMDVKPDNMLLKGGCVKLADFGAAVISSDGTTDAPYGTRCYACPESLAALPLRLGHVHRDVCVGILSVGRGARLRQCVLCVGGRVAACAGDGKRTVCRHSALWWWTPRVPWCDSGARRAAAIG